jgi:hypothetical protein
MCLEMAEKVISSVVSSEFKVETGASVRNLYEWGRVLHEPTTWIYRVMRLEISKLYTGDPIICPFSVINEASLQNLSLVYLRRILIP